VALRPAILLPPKRLSTPRSARQISPTNRGLLLGAPVPTQAGLTPAGLVQLSGRNTAKSYLGPLVQLSRAMATLRLHNCGELGSHQFKNVGEDPIRVMLQAVPGEPEHPPARGTELIRALAGHPQIAVISRRDPACRRPQWRSGARAGRGR
jgi:hypothetical protein